MTKKNNVTILFIPMSFQSNSLRMEACSAMAESREKRRLHYTRKSGPEPRFFLGLNKLHIYIDETGDTGFKLEKGSSPIFCITLLIFHDNKEIEKMSMAIQKLESNLHFNSNEEWKFSKTAPKYRLEFLKTIVNFNFEIRAVVMIKKNIDGPRLISDKDSFYNYTCKLLLQYSAGYFKDAKVIFDKRGNRDFYKNLRQYLRTKCKIDHKRIREIKSKDSKKEIPLQVVDMIAGAIGRSFSNKRDSKDYIRIINPKIRNLFRFPEDVKK